VDFNPVTAAGTMCSILNKLIVSLLKGTLIQSIAAIEAYCQILLLLVKLCDVYPKIRQQIDLDVDDMLKSSSKRHKKQLGDIGEFLVKLALSNRGINDPNVNDILLEEYSARQVFWAVKGDQNISDPKMPKRSQAYFTNSLVSHQLFVFNIEAAKTFTNPEMMKKLEANYGFPDDETMKYFLGRIDWVKKNVMNFKVFFECVGLEKKFNEDAGKVNDYVNRAFRISKAQGYTR